MLDTSEIRQHMEVVDAAGQPVGKVDSVADGVIKLTRRDAPDGLHHYIEVDQLDRVAGDRLLLKEGTALPEGVHGRDDTTSLNEDAVAAGYAGQGGTDVASGSDNHLFGTSGHGTGMGGSGAS